MTELPQLITDLREAVRGPISVVVAKRAVDTGAFDARKVNLAAGARNSFRSLCEQALDDLRERTPVGYGADAELGQGQVFVLDDAATVAELSELVSLGALAATLPNAQSDELDLSVQLYAVVAGTDPRVSFVRRVDPRITHRHGGFTAVMSDRLTKLDEPVFSFSPGFDLIVTPDQVVVLNQRSFELMYRDIGLVERHITKWIEGITQHLEMDSASVDTLRTAALRDSRMWRKLREIERRGHLAHIEITEVVKYAREMGLDPERVVRDGKLVFDPAGAADRFSFLHLLNEDMYRGFLTKEMFEAQRKSAATP